MVSRRNITPPRRLTARSVIISTLLGVDPPELPTRSLVATAELLGIAPGTARVAMSRMVTAEELDPTDLGYRLASSALLARSARQGLSRRGPEDRWKGRWRVVVVPGGIGSVERIDLREAFATARYASLRDGVWLRPDNLPTDLLDLEQEEIDVLSTGFAAYPDNPGSLAGQLWDLRAWAAEAAALADDLEQHHAALADDGPAALANGFLASAAVLRHLQADPLLPPQLLPDTWPGPVLRQAHREYDHLFKLTLRDWQRSLPR